MSTDGKRPILELVVDAQQEAVWRAVSTTDGLRQWFGYDYGERDGGRPERPSADSEAEIRAFVDEAERHPPERLVFDDGTELTLTPDGPRTVVRLVVPDVADATWEELYGGVAEGWRFYLEQLRFWLEAAPPGARRTIHLSGTAPGPRVVDLVGPGTQWYAASIVTPQGWLVSVGADPDDPAPTAVNVIVSTYGLDDTAFAAVRDDWTARWRAVVDQPEVVTAERASA